MPSQSTAAALTASLLSALYIKHRQSPRRMQPNGAASGGVASDFETAMDAQIAQILASSELKGIPGLCVFAKRGNQVYHKAHGFANKEIGVPMSTDSQFRMYSMTKVMTSAVAIMLYEQGGFQLNDPVSKYIPSFNRQWDIVSESNDSTAPFVDYVDMTTGANHKIPYQSKPSCETMKIKHLMAESSGVAYELFSDMDRHNNNSIGLKNSYSIANAIRWALPSNKNSTIYKSSCILGHDATLEEFCDIIAEAGVLVCEPGTLSYGHGATVLARVIEIVFKQVRKLDTHTPFSAIMQEMLFGPLGMKSATFFLDDADPRAAKMPVLYGIRRKDGECVRAEESIPPTTPPYSNGTDHYSGPRKFETGDTGSNMTVADYAKFCDFLVFGGGISAHSGERLLSEMGVHTLTKRRLEGLTKGRLGEMMIPCGESFNFGWVCSHGAEDEMVEYHHCWKDTPPRVNYWSGYANTHVRVYADNTSYIIIGIQLMDHAFTGLADKHLRAPLLAKFLELWR